MIILGKSGKEKEKKEEYRKEKEPSKLFKILLKSRKQKREEKNNPTVVIFQAMNKGNYMRDDLYMVKKRKHHNS